MQNAHASSKTSKHGARSNDSHEAGAVKYAKNFWDWVGQWRSGIAHQRRMWGIQVSPSFLFTDD